MAGEAYLKFGHHGLSPVRIGLVSSSLNGITVILKADHLHSAFDEAELGLDLRKMGVR